LPSREAVVFLVDNCEALCRKLSLFPCYFLIALTAYNWNSE